MYQKARKPRRLNSITVAGVDRESTSLTDNSTGAKLWFSPGTVEEFQLCNPDYAGTRSGMIST